MRNGASSAGLDALLCAAQAGDRDALSQFIERCAPLAQTAVRAKVPPDDVEDVVQDVLLAVFQALPTLRSPGALAGWLRTIAARKVADYHRNRSPMACARPRRLADNELAQGEFERVEDRAMIVAALSRLNSQHRAVLQLHAVEELSFAEVGEQLGLSAEAARSLFRRSRFPSA